MTNKELRDKYPIGTEIEYIGVYVCDIAKKDIGKKGKIVGYEPDNCPNIFLPQSEHISWCSSLLTPVTWETAWRNIKILPQKNQQLEFSFMQQS